MLKAARQDLKNAGLTTVVVNKLKVIRADRKRMEGVRGGCFGPMTCTAAYMDRNREAAMNIIAAMTRNGYTQTDECYQQSLLRFVKGQEVVRFLLSDFESAGQRKDFWWVLAK